jgi:hypothetical protein
MVWIPAGILKAGSPLDAVPRMFDEEMPLTDVPMSGFYIDVLPYPDEPGAIPTVNVTRDEAAALCAQKGKRLCTELEWERACKGPENFTFEYGNAYQAFVCSTGAPPEQGAKRPTGDRIACKSGFGVREMHGAAFEWTDGPWGRGTKGDLGVVRGGNGQQGEVVGRCVNAVARPPSSKSPTVGLRCCAGPRNDAKIDLAVQVGHILDKMPRTEDLPKAIAQLGCGAPEKGECVFPRGWVWRPAGNVEIYLKGGCVGQGVQSRCGIVMAMMVGDRANVLGKVDTGREIPEVVTVKIDRRVRVRGADAQGPFFQELIWSAGKVEVRMLAR